jgi:hypothetical protein
VELRLPRRPQPTNPKAKLAVEWADVCFYIFCLALIAVVLVLTVVTYGPTMLGAVALAGSQTLET